MIDLLIDFTVMGLGNQKESKN